MVNGISLVYRTPPIFGILEKFHQIVLQWYMYNYIILYIYISLTQSKHWDSWSIWYLELFSSMLRQNLQLFRILYIYIHTQYYGMLVTGMSGSVLKHLWQVKTKVCPFQSYLFWVALWENLLTHQFPYRYWIFQHLETERGGNNFQRLRLTTRKFPRRTVWTAADALPQKDMTAAAGATSEATVSERMSKPLVVMVWYIGSDHVFGSAKKHVLKIACFKPQDVYLKQRPLTWTSLSLDQSFSVLQFFPLRIANVFS